MTEKLSNSVKRRKRISDLELKIFDCVINELDEMTYTEVIKSLVNVMNQLTNGELKND